MMRFDTSKNGNMSQASAVRRITPPRFPVAPPIAARRAARAGRRAGASRSPVIT